MRGRKVNSQISKMKKEQTASIEYLVLSGGGVRGVEYSGMYQAFDENQMLSPIKGVSGSSAGAITAAFIASGMTSDSFSQVVQNSDMKKLLGNNGVGLLHKDGTPLYDLVSNTVKSNIAEFFAQSNLDQLLEKRSKIIGYDIDYNASMLLEAEENKQSLAHDIEHLQKLLYEQDKDIADKQEIGSMLAVLNKELQNVQENIDEAQYKKLELTQDLGVINGMKSRANDSLQNIQNRCNSANGKIYFKDLSLLRLIDPSKFKDLYVTAVQRNNGELKIFSSRETPNVEIAAACRASASLPIVMNPAKIDGVKYIDGGYKNNTPYDHFKEHTKLEVEDITLNQAKISEAKAKGRTLAFAFDNGTENLALYSAKKKVYNPNEAESFLYNVVLKAISRIGGKFKYTDFEAKRHDDIRDNALHTVVLDSKLTSTIDFSAVHKKKKYLHQAGYLQTMNYLSQQELVTTNTEHLSYQNFCLSVYDTLESKTLHGFWRHKVSVKDKQAYLIDFCNPKRWEDRKPSDVLKEYIIAAAISRTNNQLTVNTDTIDSLITTINKKSTPDEVKIAFADAIGKRIHIAKDTKFSKDDVKHFLEKEKLASHKTQQDISRNI